MIRHLLRTPWKIFCDGKLDVDATSRLPHRTTHPTEATCLRCLQLAVLELERDVLKLRGELQDADRELASSSDAIARRLS